MLESVAGFTLEVCCVDEGRQFEMQPGLEGDLQLYRSRAVQVVLVAYYTVPSVSHLERAGMTMGGYVCTVGSSGTCFYGLVSR